ncbi:hypothetical protein [Micromonospora sp. WMMC250]|uniref:hypothetical protein n=1 Tax=Micromonospora sp. WMMC250 TaxID=3014781 RepID=UPI0022B72323|nr:hypothetical protein [Micromonospora sp. WMMC250]MCZ7376294.1 hypothetical protein [Micromonospora sp. WMMC250]
MTTSTHRVAVGLAAVTLLAVALAGCGGDADKETAGGTGDVASLTTPSAPASTTGAAVNGRPQLRLDTTDEEETQLWETYKICLHEHGVKKNEGRAPGPTGSGTGLSLDQSGEPKAAYVACAGKMPLQPPELDRDRNPNYVSQWNDYVQCLRGHGLKIHSLPDGSGWTYDDGVADPTNGLEGAAMAKLERDCTMEIFGARK